MSYEEIANIIQVNLTSSILLVKALLPYLNKIESKIYLLGSRGRRFAFAGGVAYCASKAGLSLVADALSLEFRACGWNIGVSLFEFGTVATGFAAVPTNSKQITTNGAAALIFECFQRPLDDFDLRRIEVVPSVARLNHE
jgi:NAD(P)-dependent dehydrogenase (short-subunit alcohol dehydrogenase family)